MNLIIVIASVFVCFVLIFGTWRYFDHGKGDPNSFIATIFATVLGVLVAAVIGYLLWNFQEWIKQRGERKSVTKNLTGEIQANRKKLDELIGYLGRLEEWASTLESSDMIPKDLMISNGPEKGEQLKEILPYRQVSFVIEEAVSKGTLILLPRELQGMIRRLASKYRELNHRIDYCEKSSSDLVYTTVLTGASEQGRKSLITYQARSVVRFLREPAEELIRLTDETLRLLDEKRAKESSTR